MPKISLRKRLTAKSKTQTRRLHLRNAEEKHVELTKAEPEFLHDHDYSSNEGGQMQQSQSHCSTTREIQDLPAQHIMLKVKQRLEEFLATIRCWQAIMNRSVFHVVYLSSRTSNLSIQRSLDFSVDGTVNLFVHCQPVKIDPYVCHLDPPMPLDEDTIDYFVDRMVIIIGKVAEMEVCSGFDDKKFQSVWSSCSQGEIDYNPYNECRYVETFRSLSCVRLVPFHRWRCAECSNLYWPLWRRLEKIGTEVNDSSTPDVAVTNKPVPEKLKDRQSDPCSAKRRLTYLRINIYDSIKENGITVDDQTTDDLLEILIGADVTHTQSFCVQQQMMALRASHGTVSADRRWLSTMIRFALAIHLTSQAAHKVWKQTGVVQLPSHRILLDFSQVMPKEGIDKFVLDRVGNCTDRDKKYHVLTCDKIYIFQNLVFQKSSGRLLGFTSLNEIDKEIKALEQCPEKPMEEAYKKETTEFMVYVIKGISTRSKEVVATFAAGNISTSQIYERTWQVIGALESSGIAVAAFVCEGLSLNYTFIRSHIPATHDYSNHGTVFDTVNKSAPNRNLYFLCDLPCLLTSIRNCLLNSQWDGQEDKRIMMKNKNKFSLDFITKLFEEKQGMKECNQVTVFPDNYTEKSVKNTAQVLSLAVRKDMQGSEADSKTVLFLKRVNDWFDFITGTRSPIAQRKSSKLSASSSFTDSRFDLLDDFLEYLDNWQSELKAAKESSNIYVHDNSTNAQECEETDIGEVGRVTQTLSLKCMLDCKTLEGIRISTLAFKALVQVLLEQGVYFISAKIFTLEPLEDHFQKRTPLEEGSSANESQVLIKDDALLTGHIHKRRKIENLPVIETTVGVMPEPLEEELPSYVSQSTRTTSLVTAESFIQELRYKEPQYPQTPCERITEPFHNGELLYENPQYLQTILEFSTQPFTKQEVLDDYPQSPQIPSEVASDPLL